MSPPYDTVTAEAPTGTPGIDPQSNPTARNTDSRAASGQPHARLEAPADDATGTSSEPWAA